MIREKIDASRERNVILYSIINTDFLKEIYPIAKRELFKSPYAQTVWGWIAQYFEEFNKAPNKDIQDIYITHKMEVQDEEEEAVATFLQSLSDSDEQINNLDYLIKQSVEWLKLRSLENLQLSITDALSRKDYQSGEQAVAEYSRIERHVSDGVNLFRAIDLAVECFNEENEILFNFPGALGAVIGDCRRTDFISFLGFMKSGKTWWLWEAAKMAMLRSNKVLFISLEMPLPQVMRRIWLNLAKKPKRNKLVKIPKFTEDDSSTDEEQKWVVDYDEKEMEGFHPTKEYFENWIKQYKKYFHGGDVKVVSMPARSVTVKDIVGYIDNLEYYEKWIPDVVVIDYADLISSKMKGEYRHQLDDIWANLRRTALERNICVVTASQSGRASARGDATEENIAEDIRKVAHVTKMIAINATKEEKGNGIYRIAQIAERDDSTCFEQAYVLSCLDIGQVCLDSRFKSDVIIGRNDDRSS